MASSKLITFYISQIVLPIQAKLSADGLDLTKEQVDSLLKNRINLDKSKVKMSTAELQELIEWSIVFGYEIGLELGYPPDELDSKLDLRDLK